MTNATQPTLTSEVHTPTPASDEAIGFILRLGRAMHACGYPSHRLEELLEQAATRLGLQGQFFVTPTSIYCGFGVLEHQRTYLIRTEPGSLNLGKIVDLDEVLTKVLYHRLSVAEGARYIDEIEAQKPLYGPTLNTFACGLASMATSRVLGGGLKEMIVSAVIGLVIGLMFWLADKYTSLSKLFEPVAATLASGIAAGLSLWWGPYSVFNATLAGLILLVPGLTLTTALAELTTRNLVSGTSLLSSALVVFFGIGFGVTLGAKLSYLLFGTPRISASLALPWWTEYVALFLVALAFAILLRAHLRDVIWIVLVVLLAVSASRGGAKWIGPELGPFIGALTVGTASGIYSRLLQRPMTVTLAPGILLLVPGSLGFRSIASLLDNQIIPGVGIAVQMILTAMALVAGILISNILIPVRKR
ncbi:MAG TPA: threonine/serine exporter family protein [Blastocatellia bacterium]|nr:threonine/serine exporter family protein [Blastocatellia bacterium]